MRIDELRIYSGCLEQGLDFKNYFLNIDKNLLVKNIYPTKARQAIRQSDSILQKITKLKDFDLVISIISHNKEIPILLVEYSTAVPTDDHKMQRSDVYFWASVFKIPVLKISPLTKNSFGKHGGGDKITLTQELNLTLIQKAVVYFIDWQSDTNSGLMTHKEKLSCIDENKQLQDILANIMQKCKELENFSEIYELLWQEQMVYFSDKALQDLKNNFVDSTRFQRIENEIIVKINRFGHAMDPDRGILYFLSQLFGLESVTTKFIIQRQNFEGKESYKTLFDGLSNNIKTKLYELIEQPFDDKLALKLFKAITGIEFKTQKQDEKHYIVLDDDLSNFLQTYTSITYKSIFLNSHRLQFCDYHHNIICELSWNANLVKDYLRNLYTSIYTPLPLSALSFESAKEDIITYASVELLKRAGCKILATSYPDAQGDKAILIGQGRITKRIYLDIIATNTLNQTQAKPLKIMVFLQENKEKHSNLKDDEIKLLDLKQHHLNSLNVLLQKLAFHHSISSDEVYLGLGAKYAKDSAFFNVDYVFAFDICQNQSQTLIQWNIAVINFDLCDIFKPLLNSENKLQGVMAMDLIYKS